MTTEMWQAHAILQLQFDNMQAAGIIAPVPTEGWKAFCVELERTIDAEFPFVKGNGMPLNRKLADAFSLLRMLVNSNAIYLTFFHPKVFILFLFCFVLKLLTVNLQAKFRDLTTASVEGFRYAERFLAPSEELMHFAISFLQDDLFPEAELRVLRVLMDMHARELRTRCDNEPAMRQAEVPQAAYVEELRHLDAGSMGPFEPSVESMRLASAAPGPWRSRAEQRQRVLSLLPGSTKPDDLLEWSDLPKARVMDFLRVQEKTLYVSCKQGDARSPEAYQLKAADDVHSHMVGAQRDEAMPHDHVQRALKSLSERNIVDTSTGTREVRRIVAIEPVGTSERVSDREFRIVVAKAALDLVAAGSMSMRGVLQRMAHRHSKPSVYLFSEPFPLDDGTFLPQLPAGSVMPYHGDDCGVRRAFASVGDLEKRHAELRAAGAREPWTHPTILEHCTCWRQRTVLQSSGVPMPRAVREVQAASLGGDAALAAAGLTESSTSQMKTSFEELGWIQLVGTLTAKNPHDMTDAELRALDLHVAHPSSSAWVTDVSGHDGVESARDYPFSLARRYREESEREAALVANVQPKGHAGPSSTWRPSTAALSRT